jgi:hypothetical protein
MDGIAWMKDLEYGDANMIPFRAQARQTVI